MKLVHPSRMPASAAARTAAFAVALVCLFPLTASADELSVPDIETRIRNSGNAVPPSALPALVFPESAPLPAAVAPTAKPEVAVPESAPVVAAETAPAVAAPASASPRAEATGLSGFAELGGGSPGALHAALSLNQRPTDGTVGFGIDLGYSSADGYGGRSQGSGWFDRETDLGLVLDSPTGGRPWKASLRVRDEADGLQGTSEYYSLASRSAEWSLSALALGSAGAGFSVTGLFSGSLWASFAERPGGAALPAAQIGDYDGYRLEPGIRFGWKRSAFDLSLTAKYGYDVVADEGELYALRADLEAAWKRDAWGLSAGVGAFYDDEDGLSVPFAVSAFFDAPGSPVERVSLSGGIAVGRMGVNDLARENPFVYRAGLPAYAADWNAILSAEFSPAPEFTAAFSGEFRKSLPDRGILYLTGEIVPDGRVAWTRAERDSLVTKGSVTWKRSVFSVTGTYAGEWLDRLGRDSLQSLSGSLTVSDPDAPLRWSATAVAGFALDDDVLPRLALSASVRPLPRFLVTLSAVDILSLAAGEGRMLDDLYQERSGSVILSFRVDFLPGGN